VLALDWFHGLVWLCAAYSLCSKYDVDYSLAMHHDDYIIIKRYTFSQLSLPPEPAPNSGSGFPPAVLITRSVPRHASSIQETIYLITARSDPSCNVHNDVKAADPPGELTPASSSGVLPPWQYHFRCSINEGSLRHEGTQYPGNSLLVPSRAVLYPSVHMMVDCKPVTSQICCGWHTPIFFGCDELLLKMVC
jgi:hypothetical protein